MNACCYGTSNFQQQWLQLEELGVPLEPPEYRLVCTSGRGLLIGQESFVMSSSITELKHGIVACILNLIIVSDAPGKIIIMACSLELPWTTKSVGWLDGVESKKGETTYYQYYDAQLVYPQGEVLNHRIEARRPLRRGDMLSGLLLGASNEPVPSKYKHGTEIVAPLVLCDQFHRVHSGRVRLYLDRSISRDMRRQSDRPADRSSSGSSRAADPFSRSVEGLRNQKREEVAARARTEGSAPPRSTPPSPPHRDNDAAQPRATQGDQHSVTPEVEALEEVCTP